MFKTSDLRDAVEPLEDYGFFGPDSMTWKVWGYPTSLTIAIQRSVVIEELDPALVAAVTATQDIYNRPRTRYERTVRYFATVAFGDTRTATKMADVLVRVHAKAVGIEPLSGQVYDANDPHSQLWILLTGWHSNLKAYEMYGPGKLSEAEERQYWTECAIAAELQTIDPADVPRTRDGIREYFDQMQPKLAGSLIAQKAMRHLLQADAALPGSKGPAKLVNFVAGRAIRAGTIATMPRWMRQLGGIRQSRAMDIAIRPVLRIAFWVAQAHPRIRLSALKLLAPATVPVVAPAFLGIEPRNPHTMTPYEAQDIYGYDRPAEAHLDLRAKQRARALHGIRPADDGLLESQVLMGRLG